MLIQLIDKKQQKEASKIGDFEIIIKATKNDEVQKKKSHLEGPVTAEEQIANEVKTTSASTEGLDSPANVSWTDKNKNKTASLNTTLKHSVSYINISTK